MIVCVLVNTYHWEWQVGTLTLMVEFLEPSQPDEEENDKEEERPDDLDEKAAPVPFPQGQVLPEKELKLEEESHLVAILFPHLHLLPLPLVNPLKVSLQFQSCHQLDPTLFSPLQASASCCSSLEHLKGKCKGLIRCSHQSHIWLLYCGGFESKLLTVALKGKAWISS